MTADAGPPVAFQDGPTPHDGVVVPLRASRRAATPGRPVHMPKGPLGFPDHHDFLLLDVADPVLAQFKLLRAVEDQGLVLIVTPMPETGRPIADEDLMEIAATAGIAAGNAAFLLVVTVRPKSDGDGMTMSVNLRAPIVFDPTSRLARQCVIPNARYRVQHPFFGWSRVGDADRGR